MARKRASMREGPLAELFRATEAAQRQQKDRALPPEPEPEPKPPEPRRAAAGRAGRRDRSSHAPPEPEPDAEPSRPPRAAACRSALPEPAPQRCHRAPRPGTERLPRRRSASSASAAPA